MLIDLKQIQLFSFFKYGYLSYSIFKLDIFATSLLLRRVTTRS